MRYVALLRGINVGGNKKVPMAELKQLLESLGYTEVKTLLASGNVLFSADRADEGKLFVSLRDHFGFEIPVQILEAGLISQLVASDPFAKAKSGKDVRWFISFIRGKNPVPAVLDVSDKTVDLMADIEKREGKENVTTRNWQTVLKIAAAI